VGLIIAKNGIFKKIDNRLFEGYVKVDGDPKAEGIDEHLKLKCPKFPVGLWAFACTWFRYCMIEKRREGYLALCLNNGKWSVACPDQWNSMGGVHYHLDTHPEEFLGVMGDGHCHPGKGATHSHTDKNDEGSKTGIFIVIGEPYTIMGSEITIEAQTAGKKFDLKPPDFFDENDWTGAGNFPEHWKDRLHDGECKVCPKPDNRWNNWDKDKKEPSGRWPESHYPSMGEGDELSGYYPGMMEMPPEPKGSKKDEDTKLLGVDTKTSAVWKCSACKTMTDRMECTECKLGEAVFDLQLCIAPLHPPVCTKCKKALRKLRCPKCKRHFNRQVVANESNTVTR